MDNILKISSDALKNHIFLVDLIFVYIIWIVQIIIYPSFKFTSAELFKKWHDKYCFRVSFFVLPLMITQLLVGIINLKSDGDWFNFSIVSLTWISTFLISAPIHSKLKKFGKSDNALDQLIKTNWIRVALWTTLLITR